MLPRITDRLRSAVATGAFSEAEQLLNEFCRQAESDWRAASSRQERTRLEAEVTGLMRWARQVVTAQRSHAQRRLILISSQRAYGRVPQTPDRLSLDA